MMCETKVGNVRVHPAVPPDRGTFSREAPVVMSKKLTVPVGVGDPEWGALTVAVKVTGWFGSEGLAEEARPVVAAGKTAPPLTRKVLPTAVMMFRPVLRR